jgi:PAS domain S-box-containing protein
MVLNHEVDDLGRRDLGLDSRVALLAELGIAAVATDLDGIICHWNRRAAQLYGRESREMLGARISTVRLSLADGSIANSIVGALLGVGRWQGEVEIEDATGSARRLEVSATVLVDSGDQPVGFEAAFRDLGERVEVISDRDGRLIGAVNVAMGMAERKQSEHELLSARDYLRAVVDSMGEGMYALDPDGRATYINPAASGLLGWSRDELAGRDMHALTHNRTADGSPLAIDDCPILRARRDGRVVRVEDDIFICSDGSELPVSYTAAPFATEAGIEGCVVVFEDITKRKAAARLVEIDLEKLAWLERIHEALTEERFVLYGQPIVDLQTGQVVQRELLIRMHGTRASDGTAELIAPGSFLPVAEEFGVITEIDRWVIDRGTELSATGQAVQINISGRSISAPGFVDHIERALNRTGADPGKIVVEITETALVNDEPAARAFVDGVHGLGCKVALDDFGTGYGGFAYLKQFSVDSLKIDIEFVRDVRTNSASRRVVQAIVSLAAGFGLKTVGEGVEDEATLDLLRELGVDYAQGFHIGRPAPLVHNA